MCSDLVSLPPFAWYTKRFLGCRAYVVPRDPSILTSRLASTTFSKTLSEWVAARVAAHKQLRGGVLLSESIPRSAAGKILRKDLRALVKAEAEAKANAVVARL